MGRLEKELERLDSLVEIEKEFTDELFDCKIILAPSLYVIYYPALQPIIDRTRMIDDFWRARYFSKKPALPNKIGRS